MQTTRLMALMAAVLALLGGTYLLMSPEVVPLSSLSLVFVVLMICKTRLIRFITLRALRKFEPMLLRALARLAGW